MARYFFHLLDGMFRPDSEGQEFYTLAEARGAAGAKAASVIAGRDESFWNSGQLRVVVTDVGGTALFELVISATSYKQAPDGTNHRLGN